MYIKDKDEDNKVIEHYNNDYNPGQITGFVMMGLGALLFIFFIISLFIDIFDHKSKMSTIIKTLTFILFFGGLLTYFFSSNIKM